MYVRSSFLVLYARLDTCRQPGRGPCRALGGRRRAMLSNTASNTASNTRYPTPLSAHSAHSAHPAHSRTQTAVPVLRLPFPYPDCRTTLAGQLLPDNSAGHFCRTTLPDTSAGSPHSLRRHPAQPQTGLRRASDGPSTGMYGHVRACTGTWLVGVARPCPHRYTAYPAPSVSRTAQCTCNI